MNKYRICISSPPDRENLVAEIFLGFNQLAEINTETGDVSVEFYPRPDKTKWKMELDGFLKILQEGKFKLNG